HRLEEPHEDLAVGEVEKPGRCGHGVQAARYLLAELLVCAAGEEHELLLAAGGDARHACCAPLLVEVPLAPAGPVARAPAPSLVPGGRWANGPTTAPGPITADSQTEWVITASLPTVVSRSRHPGPIRAPVSTTVSPSSWVPGPISASGASTTPASMAVEPGSRIVTPSRIHPRTSLAFS